MLCGSLFSQRIKGVVNGYGHMNYVYNHDFTKDSDPRASRVCPGRAQDIAGDCR